MKRALIITIVITLIAVLFAQVKLNRRTVVQKTIYNTYNNTYGTDFPKVGLTLETVLYKDVGGILYRSATRTEWPHGMYFKGTYERFYMTVYGNTKSGLSRATNYVIYYDFTTKQLSDLYLALETAQTNDVHGGAAIWVEDDGTIVIAADTMVATNHNQGIVIRYSVNPEDPSAWAIANPTPLRNADNTVAKGTYPNLFKLAGSDTLFIIHRYADSPRDRNVMALSTDKGRTWTNVKVVLDLDGTDWALPTIFLSEDRKRVGWILRRKNDALGYVDKIYFMYSTNGVVWRNMQGTWSKDVWNVGPITQADLDNNCVAYVKTSPDDDNYDFIGTWLGSFDKNYNPVLVGRKRALSNYNTAPVGQTARSADLHIVWWDGSVWQSYTYTAWYDKWGYTAWPYILYNSGGGLLYLLYGMHYPSYGTDSTRYVFASVTDYGKGIAEISYVPGAVSTTFSAGVTGDVVGKVFSPSETEYLIIPALVAARGSTFDTNYNLAVLVFRKFGLWP